MLNYDFHFVGTSKHKAIRDVGVDQTQINEIGMLRYHRAGHGSGSKKIQERLPYCDGSLVILLCLAIGGCWILAEQYEKRPKHPGEAEIFQAEEFIRSFETEEFAGNTSEAKECGMELRIRAASPL